MITKKHYKPPNPLPTLTHPMHLTKTVSMIVVSASMNWINRTEKLT